MSRTIFITILQFILISLAQILLLNNVQLFGYVQPLLYIWFLILLPNNTPKWLLMILGFSLGLTMDLFSTQLGFHTATATLTEADGRRLVFDIKVHDEVSLIGEGTHERFIVFSEKFVAKTNAKSNK